MIAKVETRTKKCTECGRQIDVCVGCDEPGCPAPICNDCLRIETGQAMRQPHTHGA